MSSPKHCHRTSERLPVGSTVGLYGTFTSVTSLCSFAHKGVTINKFQNASKNATEVFWATCGTLMARSLPKRDPEQEG